MAAPKPEPQNVARETFRERADEALERAKRLYEAVRAAPSLDGIWEATEEAERARETYRMIEPDFEGLARTEIQAAQREANNLITLLTYEKKKLTGIEDTKPAEPEPPPAPPATPAPPAPHAQPPSGPEVPAVTAIGLFKDYAAEPASGKVDPVQAALEEELAGKEDRPILKAIALLMRKPHSFRRFKNLEERPAFVEFIRRHDPAGFEDAAPEELAQALAELSAGKGDLFQTWGRAYLSRLALFGEEQAVARFASGFGLKSMRQDGTRRFGTHEGLAMFKLGDAITLKEFDKIAKRARSRDPAFSAWQMLSRLRLWAELPEEERLRTRNAMASRIRNAVTPPKFRGWFRAIANALADASPCQACEGSGQEQCGDCIDGKMAMMCVRCRGDGEIDPRFTRRRGGSGSVKCEDCRGSGRKRGRIDCRTCKGSGGRPCVDCGAKPFELPRYQDLVGGSQCALCGGGGFVHPPLLVPCPNCAGIGQSPA